MRLQFHPGIIVAGASVVLVASACSGGSGTPTPEPAETVSQTVVASPEPIPTPSADTYPSFPAGIPTVEPSPPAQGAEASAAALMPHLTIVSPDPNSTGLVIAGFVHGVVEDGGTCEYIVSRTGSSDFVVSTTGVENVSTTSCGSTVVPGEVVPSGEYSVVLHYESDSGDARSEAVSVRMP